MFPNDKRVHSSRRHSNPEHYVLNYRASKYTTKGDVNNFPVIFGDFNPLLKVLGETWTTEG